MRGHLALSGGGNGVFHSGEGVPVFLAVHIHTQILEPLLRPPTYIARVFVIAGVGGKGAGFSRFLPDCLCRLMNCKFGNAALEVSASASLTGGAFRRVEASYEEAGFLATFFTHKLVDRHNRSLLTCCGLRFFAEIGFFHLLNRL